MKQRLRRIYHYFLNRPYWHLVNRRRAFYSQFISKGDLVFNVGANVGDYSLDFLALGAKVIAIEPNPQCAHKLVDIQRENTNLNICVAAVGESKSEAVLHVGEDKALGTLSEEWIDTATSSERFKRQKWDTSQKVQVLTIDSLILENGMPSFIKIDVEGYELPALKGLSRLPKYLSFEFNSEALHLTKQCLELPLLQNCEFNFCKGQPDKLALSLWMDSEALLGQLSTQQGYGDVLVRAHL